MALTADGGGIGHGGVYTDAGQPDVAELAVPSSLPFGQAALRIGVSFGTPSGGDTSPYGLSQVFDTLLPPRPVVSELHSNPDGSVLIGWHPDPPADVNPADPLDLAQPTTLFQVLAVMTELNAWQRLGTPSTATRYTVAPHSEPYLRATQRVVAVVRRRLDPYAGRPHQAGQFPLPAGDRGQPAVRGRRARRPEG